jgi:DNA-binding NarL/FixJ family response regulator
MGSELVAREREFDELRVHVERGAGAVVCGEPGVGKTAIAAAVAARSAADGDLVERVVATVAARPIPFGALGALLPEELTSLHPTFVLGAIVRQLREHRGRRLPLIVIDDGQFLDPQSAATILGLATSGAARLLLTIRTGEQGPDAIRALWKEGVIPRVDLAPFDRAATQLFLERELGGAVAVTTAERMWQRTQGNALFLTEIVRHARRNGDIHDQGGVWVWTADEQVPARLVDLLEQRFDGLGPAGRDAVGALVLGEPLSLDVLVALASEDGIAEAESSDLIRATERDGIVEYRFAHPLLAAVAGGRMTPSRRRTLARQMIGTRGLEADVVRRAAWHLDAGVEVDVDLLLDGARGALLTNPVLARRLADRALTSDPGPASALALADANAELGEVAAARSAVEVAVTRVRHAQDRLAVVLADASLTAFSDRRPDLALEAIAHARGELPEQCYVDLDGAAALLTAFSAQPARALTLADAVLERDLPRATELRARSARVVALSLLDHPSASLREADELVADVQQGGVSPYAQGIAHIMSMLAHLTRADPAYAPVTNPVAASWPMPADGDADVDRRVEAVAFPLYAGARRLFEGRLAVAIPALREAVAQQRQGEGLLRSEATACLAVALAASGQSADARQIMASTPPDRLAIFPGLEPWGLGAVAASQGRPEAVTLAFEAADVAHRAGGIVSAVAFLGDAARYGAAREAAERLDAIAPSFESAFTTARALAIRALASGSAAELLEAADAHAACGLSGPALGLAELAVAATRDGGPAGVLDRARSLAAELRRQLALGEPAPVASSPLTRRELEVARLAASGMTDRDIADALVVSVRTVESHLASTYRKLGISSRQELRDALPPPARFAV